MIKIKKFNKFHKILIFKKFLGYKILFSEVGGYIFIITIIFLIINLIYFLYITWSHIKIKVWYKILGYIVYYLILSILPSIFFCISAMLLSL